MLIGLDLDNTLAEYGRAFRDVAAERGLLSREMSPDKAAVRAAIRAGHDDIAWQRLQAAVYGPEIGRAELMPGADEFIIGCRNLGIRLVIVSHKSEFASMDPNGINLHQAALDWMEQRTFFRPMSAGGLGFAKSEVFFEARRELKVARINKLGCDVFVDDLPEVLGHPELAPQLRRILFQNVPGCVEGCEMAGPWPNITRHLLGAA